MNHADIAYRLETAADDAAIEAIAEEAFGPGRFARAAFKLREGGPHDASLSFVAELGGEIIGSVRLTPVIVGAGRGHLLGPLAVRPAFKSKGIGRKLVAIALDAARQAGSPAVILVGDEPYYGPLGFARAPHGQMRMERPVDPNRLLVAELAAGALEMLSGVIVHGARAREDVPARQASR